jgi:hypothetical protein
MSGVVGHAGHVGRAGILGLVGEGRSYREIGELLGMHPGRAYLLATGIPADGGDTVTGAQRQRPGMLPAHAQVLVNPRQVNPTARADVREWMRRRARADTSMRTGARP